MLEIQHYLLQRRSKQPIGTLLKELKDLHGINSRLYDDSVVLNYDQSRKSRASSLALNCRALQLSLDGFAVLSRAFDRFYNFGEKHSGSRFSSDSSLVFDKIDGSLCILYYHPDQERWHFRSRTTAYGELEIEATGYSFAELAAEAAGKTDTDLHTLDLPDKGLSYVFELVSPLTRIITPYEQTELYFLTAFHNETGRECLEGESEPAIKYRKVYEAVRSSIQCRPLNCCRFTNISELKSKAAALPPEREGFVILNRNGERFKLKNPAYVAQHLRQTRYADMMEGYLQLLESGEDLEYLAYFPQKKKLFEQMEEAKKEFFATRMAGFKLEEWRSYSIAKKLALLKPYLGNWQA